ncbi:MAG: lamin tail domain-containing protein [Candidatus Eisenbacteria bacterium]
MRVIAATGVLFLFAVVALSGVVLAASAGDVVINEIWVNDPTYFDGGEYIELYNRTASPINLAGWVISGTEYDGLCGEHHHQIPTGITIAAHGYIVIARDAITNDEVPGGSTGYRTKWGAAPDLEMYDNSRTYEVDDPAVPNTICQNPDANDDQIRLIPGTSDYSKSCSGSYNRYEVLYLYDTAARTNLIDAMEYRDPAYCTADQCLGVNVSDNDAFAGIPDVGISLGRDATGTDTNNSSADFHYEVATPRAVNIVNTPPDIWTLRYSPCEPTSSSTVTITCYAKDPNGVTSMKCYYSVDGGAYTFVAMSAAPGDSLYSCVLPAQADQKEITFYVEATDGFVPPATSKYPADAPGGAYRYRVGTQLISTVQYVDIGGDSSSYAGHAVNVSGVVTAGRSIFNANMFVIQDGSGPWNGIWVYDPTASVPAEEGDLVTVSGKVQEYYLRTEIYMFVGCYNEVSSGNALPAPVTVATSAMATTSTLGERYEAVLTKVANVTVTNDSADAYGEWEVNDGSGACRIGAAGFYGYTPNTGDVLDGVQGVGDYSYSNRKIEPRWSEDIIGPPIISSLVYAPHAPQTGNAITFSATVTGANPPFTVKLFCSTNGGASFDSTTMTTSDSVYTAVKGPWPNGTTVDYYVRATDVQPMTARKPASGTYDLYVGRVTIYQVQYVAPGLDSSSYAGKPVNLGGIVTAASGELGINYFYIQNHGLSSDFRGVKVYDRTGTVSVARGDSVTVSGDVQEYYNNTEIAMFFPAAVTIHSHSNNVPAATPVTTAAVNISEKYEGVLVQANTATVKAAKDQYGEWLISSGGAADTCKVGDYGTYAYVPVVNDVVIVRGVVDYAFSQYKIQPRQDDDVCYPAKAGTPDGTTVPSRVMLAVRPNPMLDGGEVRFALPVTGNVALKVYNVKGELVRTLIEGASPAGEYKIDWNGANSRGNRVTSGIYFLRLETRGGSAVSKVVVSR